MKSFLIFILFLSSFTITSCSMFTKGVEKSKELVGIEEPYQIDGQNSVRYSDNQFMPASADRHYRRMTKSKMEEDSQLQSGAGSMWVMEGQGAYLFSQNKARREGDLLNVKVEGAAQKQIETKVSVIKKLIKQLEEEERKAKEGNSGGKLADNKDAAGANRAPASADADKNKDKDEPINIESVPTRIVERQPDGNYRVKGQQAFMIGTREYKAIVTGMIRPEDFNDMGVSSNVLLDPQFDVVTTRKKE